MAKTTSQIVAENKKKRAEEAKIQSSRNAIHEKQMAGVRERSTAKTKSVLEKAVSGTKDQARKSELTSALSRLEREAASHKPQLPKTAEGMQKKKEDRYEAKNPVDSLQIKKDRADQQLADFDKTARYDPMDHQSNQRLVNERQRLQDAVEMAGAELNKRSIERDRAELDSMPDDTKQYFDALADQQRYKAGHMGGQMARQQVKERRNTQAMARQALREQGYTDNRIEQLLNVYNQQLNEKFVADAEAESKELAKNPVSNFMANLVSPLQNVVAGQADFIDQVGGLADRMLGRNDPRFDSIDTNSRAYALRRGAEVTQEEAVRAIEGGDPGFSRKALSYLYKGGMGLAENLLRTVLSGGSSAFNSFLNGSATFADSFRSATERGASTEEAVLLGTVDATIDYFTEKIPFDHLFKNEATAENFTEFLAKAAKDAFWEVPGELLSFLGSSFSDSVIMGDKSEFKLDMARMVADGATPEEAKKEAFKHLLKQGADTAIEAYISGFGMAAGHEILASGEQNAPVADMQEDTDLELLDDTDAPVAPEREQPAQTPPTDPMVSVAEQLGQQYPQPPKPPKTDMEQRMEQAYNEMMGVEPEAQPTVDASEESTVGNTNPAVEAQKKTETAKQAFRKALNGRITPDVLSEITHNDQILRFLHEYADLELYNGRKMSDIQGDVRSIFDYAKQNGAGKQMEQSLSRFLDDEFGSEYYSPEYQENSASVSDESTAKKEYISLEDYANKESPVWRNVAYEDESTKSSIMQETHKQMVDAGAVVKVDAGVMENVEQSFPDLRGMKKKERTPILKQAISTLKNNLRQYLGGISNQSFEFEVNGKILDAKLYSTGINEVLEKVNKEKAGMLYSSEDVFRNARYLYSTPDYDGDTKVFRWNYFYTPVQIGDEVVGVRIAVRDMAIPRESQIYNWGIKKDTPLDGVGRGMNSGSSHGVSSGVSTNNIPQSSTEVNRNSPDISSMSEDDFIDSMGNGAAESNPFADRSWHEVGKRSEKAFMHQNPEIKPLFQHEAAMLYSELGDTTRGERTFNEEAYYQSGGEAGWSGTKRHTSDSIADLLDNGFTYDQIEKGLMSIMEDHGEENNAAAKRIEFIINDRLLNGYTNFYDGSRVPPNADYVKFANGQSAPDTDTQNQSAEGGQQGAKPAMGAANANFTGKPAYNATLSEENRQADRRDDVRPMELPKTDVKGNPVSAVTGNAYGSAITPDGLASAMEEPVARGDFSYMKIPNDKATQMAADTIGRCTTWEDALKQWSGDVQKGIAGAEMSARGALLLNHTAQEYQAAKDAGNDDLAKKLKADWLGTLHDMQQLGTNTAQGLQAMRIVRSLAPPDKVDFIRLTTDRLASDLKLGKNLEIDQKLMTELEKAKTDEARDEVIGKIQENVAKQIPASLIDKFNALRYTNMLGNLKTNVRNVGGNFVSKGMYWAKDKVAAATESIVNRITGEERSKTMFVLDKNLMEACKKDFEQFADLVGGGGKFGDQLSAYDSFKQGVMDKRQIFKFKPMEGYRKATNWMMNNGTFGDEAFGRAAYSRALAGYLKANGMSAKEFTQVVKTGKGNTELVDRARAYAVQQAQEATFHDNTALARILKKKTDGIIGQGIMPFTKTPANVLIRAEEFSPLGFINSTVKSIEKTIGGMETKRAAAGKDVSGKFAQKAMGWDASITGNDLIDSWSKTFTGTGVFVLGAFFMKQGWCTGGPDDDDEKAQFDKMNGVQNYALKLPNGKTYTMDWATPGSMPFFMGANFWKAIEEDGRLNFADLENVFTAIGDPMLKMSMLQGIDETLGNIKFSKNNLGQFLMNAASNYLLQGISNTALGQLEKSMEENRTTTYIDKDSSTPEWMQRQLGKLSQKIPGWDYQQTEYLNAWGEPQKNVGGKDSLGSFAYNLLSPGFINEEDNSPIAVELNRLREVTGENIYPDAAAKTITYTDKSGEVHQDVNLTVEQWQTMQKTQGQTSKQLIQEMMDSKDYKAMTDEQKARVVQQIYSFAKEKAEQAVFKDHEGYAENWMYEAESGKTAAYIMNRVANSEINQAMSGLKTGWGKGHSKEVLDRYDRDLNTAYESYSNMSKAAQKEVMEFATGDTARYIEARDSGVTHEHAVATMQLIASLKPEADYTNVRDIQVRETITNNRNLSEREKDKMLLAYMPDYDPKAKTPQTTELKYNAIRDLGISPKGYTDAYRDYLDASGRGKRKRTIRQYVNDYGLDWATASELYDIYAGYSKPWE